MRVLFAEDDSDIRTFVEMTLEGDHEVVSVANGAEALAAIRDQSFGAAVLDVMMPHVNGLDVVRAIRKNERLRDIPIVLLTAKVQEDDHIAGFEVGADRYLTKPFDPLTLLEFLDELGATPVHRRIEEREEQLRQARFLRTLQHRF